MEKVKRLSKSAYGLAKRALCAVGRGIKKTLKFAAVSTVVLLIVGNLAVPLVERLERTFPSAQVYVLFLLAPDENGLKMIAAPKIVAEVYKKSDLLCYTDLQAGTKSCVSYPIYVLKELNLRQ